MNAPESTNRPAGIALLVGSLGGLLTMAAHPSGHIADLTLPVAQHLALTSAAVHALAIASTVLLFLGACGLTDRLRPQRQILPFAALVTFAFASVAILTAAAVSGFIVPRMFLTMLHDDPAYLPTWHIAASAIFQFNQAFSQLYTAGVSIGITLWSASALRTRLLPHATALYGAISGPILLLLLLVGHIRLNVHGMAAIVLVQAIWLIAAAIPLIRD